MRSRIAAKGRVRAGAELMLFDPETISDRVTDARGTDTRRGFAVSSTAACLALVVREEEVVEVFPGRPILGSGSGESVP